MAEYQTIQLKEIRPGIIQADFLNPPANTLTQQALQDLIQLHHDMAENPKCHVLILASASDRFFCNGMDPGMMLSADLKLRQKLFLQFIEMIKIIYAFPKLEIALIGGHAMAGGAFLPLACDYRIMASDQGRFSFSEIHAGIPIPRVLQELIQSVVGPTHMRNLVLEGAALTGTQALATGLVDRVTPQQQLQSEGLRFLNRFHNISMATFLRMKLEMRAGMREQLHNLNMTELEEISYLLGDNFSNAMQSILERKRPHFTDPIGHARIHSE